MNREANVAFVCLHGSAKSVIAAAHFRNLVCAFGKDIPTLALGMEPDAAFPPDVIAGLQRDGVSPGASAPQAISRDLLRSASHVVSFGPDVSPFIPAGCEVIYWNGVPNVSHGYDAARTEILARVARLVEHEIVEESGLVE